MSAKLICYTFSVVFLILSCASAEVESTNSFVELSEGTNIAVAVSKDEKYLVFDLQGALYKKKMGEAEASPITGYFIDARQPDISPDGSKIAFQSYKVGNWQISMVDSNGKNLKHLTSGLFDHREPDFSPEGDILVFSSDRSGSYDLWTINLKSGEQEFLTNSDYNDYGPSFSNDGLHVAFIRHKPGKYELNILNLQTLQIETIYDSEYKLYSPSWDTKDDAISFTEHNWLNSQLKQINIESKKTTALTPSIEDVFPFRVQHFDEAFYYTSNGTIQKYSDGKTEVIPFTSELPVNGDSNQKRKFSLIDTLPQKVKGIHCPKISPDGSMVSFIALGDVWIKELASERLIRVTDDSFIQLMPTWHPDGNNLVFATDWGNGPGLWNYNLETQLISQIGMISAMPSGVAFSPSGNTIAYTMAFGPRSGRLSLMDYSSGESKSPRSSFPFSTSAPSWYSDGKHILLTMLQPYSSLYREGIARNIIVNIETGETRVQKAPQHISFGARTNDSPILADHDQTLIYISQGNLKEVSLDQELNIEGEEKIIYQELADVPSLSAAEDKILFMSGADLKILDRKSGLIDNIKIELEYHPKKDKKQFIIHAGTVISMDEEVLINQDIFIKNGMIEKIAPHQEREPTEIVVDASDQFVMPGLIDMHAHQGSDLGTSLGYKWLTWGVTSTRDPATYPYDAQNRKEAQINGNLLHPRIFYTGSPIDGNRVYYNGTYAQFSEEQIKRELQRSKALNYDLVKTYVRLPDSLQKGVIEYAHQAGLPVTSHELYPAALMGIDGVEHIMGTSRRGYTPKMSETFRSYEDVPKIMAAAKMTFTPTISIYSGYNYMLYQHPGLLDDPRIEVLESPFSKSSGKAAIKQVAKNPQAYREMFFRQSELIKKSHDLGVQLIAGTDSPIIPYGFGLFVELLCYQAAGLKPLEVLQTATTNAAEALNCGEQIGRIKEGMIADLLILDKDPTKDIMHLKTIDKIILSGELLELENLLNAYIDNGAKTSNPNEK